MGKVCSERKVKKLLFCCDIDSETILLIIASVVLHIAFIHLYAWIVFYCTYVLVPHLILMALYFLGGFFLLFGVIFSMRVFMALFPWIMLACLVGNVIYVIMLCVDQACICRTLAKMTEDWRFDLAVFAEYYILGLIPGINFVITFYVMLLVADYLAEYCEDD